MTIRGHDHGPSRRSPGPRPGDRWRQLLGSSAVPQAILDGAPEPEGSLERERFRWRPEEDAAQPPQVADEVEPADVAVSHHAIYRVVEIEDFISALTTRARHRTVLELSAHPPLVGLNPLWQAFHGIERPEWLVADEAQAAATSPWTSVTDQRPSRSPWQRGGTNGTDRDVTSEPCPHPYTGAAMTFAECRSLMS